MGSHTKTSYLLYLNISNGQVIIMVEKCFTHKIWYILYSYTFTWIHLQYIEFLSRITDEIGDVHYISDHVPGWATGIQIFVDAFGGATNPLHKTDEVLSLD